LRLIPVLVVAVAAVLLAVALALAGWFVPVSYPDTAGYLRAAESATPWSFERHPLYGWLILAIDRAGLQRSSIAPLQFLLQVLAALALTSAALAQGLDRKAATALGLAALLNQALVIWGNALLPEALAMSLFTLVLAFALLAMRERLFWPMAIAIAAVFAAACILRPIVAPGLVMIPLLYLLLCRRDGQGWRGLRALILLALMVVPLVAQSAVRYREVGHFGIVSFSGFGRMGLAAQVLSPDLVSRLPEAQRALAVELLAAKQKAVDAQTAMPLFRNSVGERSFATTALDGFDTLARNYDEILWGQVAALQKPDEAWVAFDRRMGALANAIVRAAPERQVFWTAGATARLIGRLLTYNVAFVVFMVLFVLAALWNIARHGNALGGASGRSWTPLVLVVGAWVVSTSALTVIAAFPALRYTDTAGVMVSALPLYGLFLALAKTKTAAPA
jgi:hypothetical protein